MESNRSAGPLKTKPPSAALVVRRAFSKRTAINEFQAQHFCGLCRSLIKHTIDHFEVEASADLPEQGWDAFTQMSEYGLFMSGAYACGFVCSDLTPNFDIDAVCSRPVEALADRTLPQLRHYMHTLMRSERAGYGYGSVLYESLRSGALENFCERLENDPDLYESL